MTTELLIDENMSKKIIQWACQAGLHQIQPDKLENSDINISIPPELAAIPMTP